MSRLPRISIVTPSFNQAAFLEETLRSVLEQDYANLQYVVIDGGSTDGSLDILEKYRRSIVASGGVIVSERDRGQTEAINKGLRRCDGEIVGWLCSDDVLRPGALRTIAETAAANPESSWFAGACRMMSCDGTERELLHPTGDFTLAGVLFRGADRPFELPQPSVYWRRALHDRLGYLREEFHYCLDFEFWLRLLHDGQRPVLLDTEIAAYRLHDHSKTCAQPEGFLREHLVIERSYAKHLPLPERLRMAKRLGYQRRAYAVRTQKDAELWREVARRPWWLLSQQVRGALFPDRRRAA